MPSDYRIASTGTTPRRHERRAEELRISTGQRLTWALLAKPGGGSAEAMLTASEARLQSIDVDAIPPERVLMR